MVAAQLAAAATLATLVSHGRAAHVPQQPLEMEAARMAPQLASASAGRYFSLYRYEGQAYGMGSNAYGQLSSSAPTDFSDVRSPRLLDVHLPDNQHVAKVAAGYHHTFVITDAGRVYGLGRNHWGQLGDETAEDKDEPVLIKSHCTSVAAGYGHSLFLSDGDVWVSGLNNHGQLGDGTNTNRPILHKLEDLPFSGQVVDVAAGYDFSYFLTAAGDVYATGQNIAGQLGDGTGRSRNTPVWIMGPGVKAIAAGESHGLFLMQDGTLYATGANFAHQVDGSEDQWVVEPVVVPRDSVSNVFAGGDSTCFTKDGALQCMGDNIDGQLCQPEPDFIVQPTDVQVPFVEYMGIGATHSVLSVHGGHQVLASGANDRGQLGNDTVDGTSTPIIVVGEGQTLTTTSSSASPPGPTASTTSGDGGDTETSTRPPGGTTAEPPGESTTTAGDDGENQIMSTTTHSTDGRSAPGGWSGSIPRDQLFIAVAVISALGALAVGYWILTCNRRMERARETRRKSSAAGLELHQGGNSQVSEEGPERSFPEAS